MGSYNFACLPRYGIPLYLQPPVKTTVDISAIELAGFALYQGDHVEK